MGESLEVRVRKLEARVGLPGDLGMVWCWRDLVEVKGEVMTDPEFWERFGPDIEAQSGVKLGGLRFGLEKFLEYMEAHPGEDWSEYRADLEAGNMEARPKVQIYYGCTWAGK